MRSPSGAQGPSAPRASSETGRGWTRPGLQASVASHSSAWRTALPPTSGVRMAGVWACPAHEQLLLPFLSPRPLTPGQASLLSALLWSSVQLGQEAEPGPGKGPGGRQAGWS